MDLPRQFGAACPDYGFTESVLIVGNKLVCCPGGTNGFMVALDKKTGAPVWANREVRDAAGFAYAIPAADQPIPQVVTLTAQAIVGVDVSTGKLLWRHPFTNIGRHPELLALSTHPRRRRPSTLSALDVGFRLHGLGRGA